MYELEQVIIFDARKVKAGANFNLEDYLANEKIVADLNEWLKVHPAINLFKRYIGYYNGLLMFVIWYK